jgi:nitroreductase
MKNLINQNVNEVFDEIIRKRRSVRAFKSIIPSKEIIKEIIKAGAYAPYAALAVSDISMYRRFFVFTKNHGYLERINTYIKETAKSNLEKVKEEIKKEPDMKEEAESYIRRLESFAMNGFIGIAEVPCLIIVAEKRGLPSVERQSLAHVLENMWLKTTAMDLGMHLFSLVENLSSNEEFSKLLKLEHGEYTYTGCVVGYPLTKPEKKGDIQVDKSISWY